MPSRRLLIGGGVLLLVVIVLQATLRVSVQDIEDAVAAAGVFGPIAYGIVLFFGLSVPFNPVSDVATVNVAALVFSPEVSIVATFIAQTASLAVNYTVARRYGSVGLRLITGRGEIGIVTRLGDRMGYGTVFVTRFMLPLTAIGVDFISYLAGMRRMSFLPFMVVSLVPWTLMSVVYFYSTSYLKDRSLVLFFLPAVVLIVGPSLLVYLWRRFRRPATGIA
jgi:uncharacterized membrane protein YdjX (TVP38/TMEM64 family)